jgi:hypothetical protein
MHSRLVPETPSRDVDLGTVLHLSVLKGERTHLCPLHRCLWRPHTLGVQPAVMAHLTELKGFCVIHSIQAANHDADQRPGAAVAPPTVDVEFFTPEDTVTAVCC